MSNRLSRTLSDSTVETYAYEGGCISSIGGFPSLRWNLKDMLRSTTSEKAAERVSDTTYFVYDINDSRIRKETERSVTPGGAPIQTKATISLLSLGIRRNFASDGITVASSQQLVHIRGDDLVAVIQSDGYGSALERYRLGNGLELDGKGNVISYEEYSPFGVSTLRVCRADVQSPSKFRYSNYERDSETDLDYCKVRYYTSRLGRWTSPDPSGMENGLSIYAYCGNDPINLHDLSGRGKGWRVPKAEAKDEAYVMKRGNDGTPERFRPRYIPPAPAAVPPAPVAPPAPNFILLLPPPAPHQGHQHGPNEMQFDGGFQLWITRIADLPPRLDYTIQWADLSSNCGRDSKNG
ncbi:hypothetical protein K458DRAFT_402459 [Lentithecium fluviatile CBS 122367]|uniref:RHS repeat-associated core domain-containing protein n=1 Tax=Lentithecium fluviatile CBS 122367 TaxID=1168545 RepID=A0A6G1J8S9_9PLEO|nr:hypothetical protein K458DRAFT_402459 [Lentithecium fluviatile CBS 122367]